MNVVLGFGLFIVGAIIGFFANRMLSSSAQETQKLAAKASQTQLLQQATPENIENMPFFSKETQEQLAQTVNLRHKKNLRQNDETVSEPPLDYSGAPSGLFDDKKHSVTNSTSNG